MSKQVHGRAKRRTKKEIERILRAYDRSGLSQARFAVGHGVAISTLAWWLRRRRESASKQAPTLVPVTLSSLPRHARTQRIEVVLASGRKLRVGVDTDAKRIGELVSVLDS